MKLLRIKWENITLMIFGTFFIYCMAKHTARNGFDINIVMFEILLYGLVLTMNYTAIHYARKSFINK